MKKLFGMITCILITSLSAVANADDATLKIKMSDADKNNRHFLCVNGTGCVSISAAVEQGKTYPLTPGQIERIFMVDRTNLRTHFQALPASCNITVDANHTLTVKGKVVNDANGGTRIDHLECSVA